MADFRQAVKWLKEGKKIRRRIWGIREFYWYLQDPKYKHSKILQHKRAEEDKTIDYWSPDLIQAEDWEIYTSLKDFIEYMKKDGYPILIEPTEMMCNHYGRKVARILGFPKFDKELNRKIGKFVMEECTIEARRVGLYIQDKIKEWENGKLN